MAPKSTSNGVRRGGGDEGQASSPDQLDLHRANVHVIISLLQPPAVLLANAGHPYSLIRRGITGFPISDTESLLLSQSESSAKAPGRA